MLPDAVVILPNVLRSTVHSPVLVAICSLNGNGLSDAPPLSSIFTSLIARVDIWRVVYVPLCCVLYTGMP